MSGFPRTPEYTGLNAPLGQEYASFLLGIPWAIRAARREKTPDADESK